MKLNTRHFGEIEINEEKIIYFDEGIPSFEYIKRFIIISNPNPQIPFQWLQAVDDPNIAFVIANPFLFNEKYEFDIPDKIKKQLNIQNPKEVEVYSIAVVPDDIQNMTINLQAPIIINTSNNKAKQIILDNEKYPIRYYLFKPLNVYGGEK